MAMRRSPAALPSTQRGATLVIALLILVMIMMYGIPAAMDSIQNERMAGNTRNRDLAFQAAEHALKRAEASMETSMENWISTHPSSTRSDALNALAPAAHSCSDSPDDADPISGDGIFPNGECHANDVAYWRDTFNWTSNGVNPSGLSSPIDSNLVAAQPCYIVERMPDVPSGSAGIKHYYRITARAVGKDSNAIVILQTTYEFTD